MIESGTPFAAPRARGRYVRRPAGLGGLGSATIAAGVLAVTLVVTAALHRRCTTGSSIASATSLALAGVFLAYAIIGVFSIAPFYLPAAVALSLAALLTPDGSIAAE